MPVQHVTHVAIADIAPYHFVLIHAIYFQKRTEDYLSYWVNTVFFHPDNALLRPDTFHVSRVVA